MPRRLLSVLIVPLLTLASGHVARAFYDPGMQRWINRDPVYEPGFVLLEGTKRAWQPPSEVDLYAFVRNNPLSFIDPYGLVSSAEACPGAAPIWRTQVKKT
jgi:RHS repeat-associated protein